MKKGDSTRSGMLWEVERILDECKELNTLPNILFMENVPEVIGKKNIKDFQEWVVKLESLGYSNYVECLNSKDYGIPQNRNRCFMISILGDFLYKFPMPFKLQYRLKDFLEPHVDEKYYLSSDKIKGMYQYSKSDCFMKNKDRFTKGKELADTLQTNPKEGVVVKQSNELIKYGSYYTWKDNKGNYNTQCNRAANENECALTIACAETGKVLENNLRIRKLSPRETFRLMGVKDEDFDKIKNNQSDSSLYHLAGDSIVVDVMKHIFKNLL